MLKYYNSSHEYLGMLTQYRELKIESQTGSGDKSLSFILLEDVDIKTEFYIRDGKDEYVVKEIDRTTGDHPVVYGALNLEELEGKAWKTFQATDSTIAAAARLAIAGTGWTVASSDVTKKRNAGIMKKSALGVLEDLCTAFLCEVEYDTINKTISFYEAKGSDRGVYFLAGLNLRQLSKKTDSYDYYTRIIPYGADGLDIKDVNGGVEYLDNFQYSSKVRTYIWEDTNYTDAAALKEDAAAKLADMSKPKVSYSAQIYDLAEMSEKYSLLDFGLGDTITLIDKSTGTKEKQRIVKLVEYPDEPERNSCELSNTSLTWEEMQARLAAAASIVDAVIGSDGNYNGTIKVSDILHFADGVIGTSGGSDVTIGNFFQTTSGALGALQLEVGEIKTNMLTADEADIKYATIANLNAAVARIGTLEANSITAEYADLHYATIDNLDAATGRITTLETNALTAATADLRYATINLSNVATESVKDLLVTNGIIKNATIVDGHVTGVLDAVTVNASDIVAGTLSVERLLIRGSTSGLVYALNNYGTLTSTQVNTIDGYVLTPRTITADRIVAGAITANEINTSDLYTNFLLTNILEAAKAKIATLSAITANIGTITAGILRSSDYSYTSGNTYTTKGMIIDLNNKIIRTPKTAILADGSIYSSSVDLEGKITATSGSIGGWEIDNSSLSYSHNDNSAGIYDHTILDYGKISGMRTDSGLAIAKGYNLTTDGKLLLYVYDDNATPGVTIISSMGNHRKNTILDSYSLLFQYSGDSSLNYDIALDAGRDASGNGVLTLHGTPGTVYFIAPNIKATGAFYGSLTGHASLDLPLTGGTLTGNLTINTKNRGYYLTDSTGFNYPVMYDNGSNLWIGSTQTADQHHRGGTYISAGYNGSDGNSSIYICVPNSSNNSGTNYLVLHAGNYSSYALPKSGGTLTGGLVVGGTVRTSSNGTYYITTNLTKGTTPSSDSGWAGLAWLEQNYTTTDNAGRFASVRQYLTSGGTNMLQMLAYAPVAGSTTVYRLDIRATSSTGFVYTNCAIGVNKTGGADGNAGVWANTAGNLCLTGAASAGSYIYFYYNKATSSTANFHESSSGTITLTGNFSTTGNIIGSGEIHAGGKGISSDGKAGSILSTGGHLYMQATSGSHIYFCYGSSTTPTSQIYESASGAIRINADLRVPSIWSTTTTANYQVSVVDSNGLLRRYSSSSKRYKHGIKELTNYKDVLNIPVVSFVYNNDYLGEDDQRYGKNIPGFIAEDVYKFYPIAADLQDGKVENWNINCIIPPMLAVEQDHERRIAELEKENKALRAEIKALKGAA